MSANTGLPEERVHTKHFNQPPCCKAVGKMIEIFEWFAE